MPRWLARALALVTWLAVTPAVAQSAMPARDETVAPLIVEAGPAPKPKTVYERSHSFVQAFAAVADPRVDQISRWREAVCVKVVGLPLEAQGAAIKARIETMARRLGLPPARANCKANVEIAFTADPQGEMDIIAARVGHLLGYHHLAQRAALKTVTHPIQAWYVTATRSSNTNTAGVVAAGLKYDGIEQDGEVIDDPDHRPPPGCVSRITSCYTSVFKNVLIIADEKVLDGVRLGVVADDMLMLALSQPASLEGCNALPSVIDRFARTPCAGREPPDGLTAADSAYLTALYAADLSRNRNFGESDIATRMAKILGGRTKPD